jgi:hypothetical protein
MSIKFAIRNTAEKAKKEGDSFIRFTGTGEPFNRDCERASRSIETDPMGNAIKWSFQTGLDEEQVEYYNWLTDEEKEVVREQIKTLRPKIEKYFGGKNVINPENYTFWKKRRDINKLKVTHENIDVFYDTEKPEHALLYLSILSGAFSDIVAPNRDWAERFQLPHYLALEIESNNFGDEDDITRADAMGELTLLRREFGKDALYILAWCLQYDTNAFGAYNYSTTEKDLINYHIKFIEGKLVSKKKKNMPKTFMEYAEKWRGAQTRALLYTEAYVKAGEYFNFISQREKKYVTSEGTVLGNTIAEAVKNLNSPKYKIDLQNLRDSVEAKWKE